MQASDSRRLLSGVFLARGDGLSHALSVFGVNWQLFIANFFGFGQQLLCLGVFSLVHLTEPRLVSDAEIDKASGPASF
jgi:hypothetical protein